MISKKYQAINHRIHDLMVNPYHFRYTANGLPYYNDGVKNYIFVPSPAVNPDNVMMCLKYDASALAEIRRAQQFLKEADYDTCMSLELDITADPESFGPVALNASAPKEPHYLELRVWQERCVITLYHFQNAIIIYNSYADDISSADLFASQGATALDILTNAISYGTAFEIDLELDANQYKKQLRKSDSLSEHLIIKSIAERIEHDYLNRQQHEYLCDLFNLFSEQGWLTDGNITDLLPEDLRAQVMADNITHNITSKRRLLL